MEVSRGIILVGPQLLIFGSKNRELLEIIFFFSPYLFGELVNKEPVLPGRTEFDQLTKVIN